MSAQKSFVYVLEPDTDGGWHAFIPAVRGCRTWGRSIAAARRYIREALATCVDVLGENAEQIARDAVLREKLVLDGEARRSLEKYYTDRDRAAELQRLAQASVSAAARVLTKHLSLRDAGELLGLSHERVSQVIAKKTAAQRSKAAGAFVVAGMGSSKIRMGNKPKQSRRTKGAA